MFERLLLGVMGLVFGLATFAATGAAVFLMIAGMQEYVAHRQPPPLQSYALNQQASAVR